ncbi:hypothetical protein BDW02DRAFT_480717, partial [Decorospora gaudefroyi]
TQQAFPPPLPNHLSADYSPALAMMQSWQADVLRIDKEHLRKRQQAHAQDPT